LSAFISIVSSHLRLVLARRWTWTNWEKQCKKLNRWR